MTSTTSATIPTTVTTTFEVHVSKDTFKFNAAHFVAFKGFRERLHGHNYKVSVRLLGSRKIGADGYLIDFGEVKGVTKMVCKELNEHFLCPTLSDVMEITERTEENGQVSVLLNCEDGSKFVFPKSDCAMLPIVHATTEELAIHMWGKILNGLNAEYLLKRGIHTMELNVAEAVGQDATFRMQIPHGAASEGLFDVATYLARGEVVPMPCIPLNGSKKRKAENGGCSDKTCNCLAPSEFSAKLQKLSEGLSQRDSPIGNERITPEYLKDLMNR